MRYQNLTVNMMVRDEENTIGWAIHSVAPFVKEVIICDTGSMDLTLTIIKECQKKHSNIRLIQKPLPSEHQWGFNRSYDVCGVQAKDNIQAKNRIELGKIRQFLVQETTTPWMMIVDGDEIWHRESMRTIIDFIKNPSNVKDKDCLFVPLIWISRNPHFYCVHTKPAIYTNTGRIFRVDGLSILGGYPNEMAFYNGQQMSRHFPSALELDIPYPMFHYEPMFKPWRREILEDRRIPIKYPQSLIRYITICGIKSPISVYINDGNTNELPKQNNILKYCTDRSNIRTLMQTSTLPAKDQTPISSNIFEEIKKAEEVYNYLTSQALPYIPHVEIISHPIGRCQDCGVTGPLFSLAFFGGGPEKTSKLFNLLNLKEGHRFCNGCVHKTKRSIDNAK